MGFLDWIFFCKEIINYKNRRRIHILITKKLLITLIVLLAFISGCQTNISSTQSNATAPTIKQNKVKEESDGVPLTVHFIDVGQADAVLLESDGYYMMIDAGNNDDSSLLVEYLKSVGVQKLDYMIGTHLHEDHIGSMDTIIENFNIETVILPDQIHTTDTFEDVLTAISDKGLQITTPAFETTFYFHGIAVSVLTPKEAYDDLNNGSVVLKIEDKDISFLFTGDIEKEAEQELLESGYDISADILKVAHHGSDTSSTEEFIDAVSPQYAVISVGNDNTYGHPDKSVLDRLDESGIQVLRTDQQGTVEITTDGKSLKIIKGENQSKDLKKFNDDKSTDIDSNVVTDTDEETINTPNQEELYIGNTNTKKFHLQSCNKLPAKQNQEELTDRKKAIELGFIPCKLCNP